MYFRPWLFRRRVFPLAQWKQRRVYRLIFQPDLSGLISCLRGLEPILVVALRELRLIVRSTRFVAFERAHGDCASQDQHIPQLASKIESLIRPLGAVLQIDFLETIV